MLNLEYLSEKIEGTYIGVKDISDDLYTPFEVARVSQHGKRIYCEGAIHSEHNIIHSNIELVFVEDKITNILYRPETGGVFPYRDGTVLINTIPYRQTKKGVTNRNTVVKGTNDLLNQWVSYKYRQQIYPIGVTIYSYDMLQTYFNPKYLSYEECITKINLENNWSAALDNEYHISILPHLEELILFKKNIPVGIVTLEGILLEKEFALFLEEVSKFRPVEITDLKETLYENSGG